MLSPHAGRPFCLDFICLLSWQMCFRCFLNDKFHKFKQVFITLIVNSYMQMSTYSTDTPCTVVWYLHIMYTHPLIYLKSSLDYVKYPLPCKCYINNCKYNVDAIWMVARVWQTQVLLFGTFWNSFFFFPSIFNLQLVESWIILPFCIIF